MNVRRSTQLSLCFVFEEKIHPSAALHLLHALPVSSYVILLPQLRKIRVFSNVALCRWSSIFWRFEGS